MHLSKEAIEQRLRDGLPREVTDAVGSEASGPTRVDLCALYEIREDEEFVRASYKAILGRECDSSGLSNYLDDLRAGIPRESVIWSLVHSQEAVELGWEYAGLRPVSKATFKQRLVIIARRAARRTSTALKDLSSSLRGRWTGTPAPSKMDLQLLAFGEGLRQLSVKQDSSLASVSLKLDEYIAEVLRRSAELQRQIEILDRRGKADAVEVTRRSAELQARLQSLGRLTQELAMDLQSARDDHAQRLQEVDLRITQSWCALSEKVDVNAADLAAKLAAHELAQHSMEDEVKSIEHEVKSIGQRLRPAVFKAAQNVVVTEVEGFIMGLPASEWRLAAYYAFRGVPEPGLFKLFENTIRQGMGFIDVGASVGIYTLQAARLVGEEGRVFSFEPTPEVFAILKGNVQVNGFLERGSIVLSQVAISDRSGTATLTAYLDNSGHNTLFPAGNQGTRLQVPTVSLDEAIPSGASIDIVKIDAEGAEPFILRGMSRLIKQNRHIQILMEFAPELLQRSGVPPLDFLKEIADSGFDIKGVDALTGELHPVSYTALMESISAIISLTRRTTPSARKG